MRATIQTFSAILIVIENPLAPLYGSVLAIISQRTIAKLYTSAFSEYSSARSISGAAQSGLPQCVMFADTLPSPSLFSTTRERPKSASALKKFECGKWF